MDPNANLGEQRRLIARINACRDVEHERRPPRDTQCQCVHLAERLAELVEALDAWIKRGGFLPNDWKRR